MTTMQILKNNKEYQMLNNVICEFDMKIEKNRKEQRKVFDENFNIIDEKQYDFLNSEYDMLTNQRLIVVSKWNDMFFEAVKKGE